MSFGSRIADARRIAQKPKNATSGNSWYSVYFVNHFSIYISYVCAKLGMSPNVITVCMGITGLCGSFCMLPGHFGWNVVGAGLWQLWFVLDCVDGEVARLRKRTSILGVYLDGVTHVIVNPTFVLAFGLHVYLQDPSTLNLAVAVIAASAWHWKRGLPSLRDELIEREAGDSGPLRRRTWIGTVLNVVGGSLSDVGAMLLLSAVILVSYVMGLVFTEYFLYGYTLALLAYVGAMILYHTRQISQAQDSRTVR